MGKAKNMVKINTKAGLCESPTVVAFDPGGTTGWSVMVVHPEGLTGGDDGNVKMLNNVEHWSHGQIDCGTKRGTVGNALRSGISDGESLGVHEMLEICAAWPGAVIVIEDFVLRKMGMQRELLAPVRVTAAFEYGLMLNGLAVIRQAVSEAKTTATDDRLRSWHLYRSEGGLVHARDADRHAITFLRKARFGHKGLKPSALRAELWPHIYGRGAPYGTTGVVVSGLEAS